MTHALAAVEKNTNNVTEGNKMSLSIIVAIAQNNAIGKNNQLLWHISADLKRFKQLTSGKTVIMGRNTYLSLPIHPLPNRKNIVITDVVNEHFEGSITVYSIDEAIALCKQDEENFIIGGAMIYKQFLPLANKLYITKVFKEFEADTFFPEIDRKIWEIIEKADIENDTSVDFKYSYLTYKLK